MTKVTTSTTTLVLGDKEFELLRRMLQLVLEQPYFAYNSEAVKVIKGINA